MAKITVKNTDVNVIKVNGEDYICLTDMLQAKDGDFFITDWLRNRNTLEFIGIWEKVYNPNFNPNRSLDSPSVFPVFEEGCFCASCSLLSASCSSLRLDVARYAFG